MNKSWSDKLWSLNLVCEFLVTNVIREKRCLLINLIASLKIREIEILYVVFVNKHRQ